MRAVVGHFEIPARDPRSAGEFFSRVFGWSLDPVEWEGPAYFKLRAEEQGGTAMQGGILDAGAAGFDQPLPVIHLREGSIEDCLARIEAAGGSIDAPVRAVGDMGVFARFRDPEGHRWGLWVATE